MSSDQIHSYVDEAGDPTLFGSKRGSGIIVGNDGCSKFFIMGKLEVADPEVLLTYLRLPVICELMDLHMSASLYPAISERDLLKLPIPKIQDKVATQIITHIRQAHAARQEAQTLLAKAKRAVEVAVEEGEATTLEFLKS